jgi:GT2 family glycosyltransferase
MTGGGARAQAGRLRISVLVTSYGRPDYLVRCLESLAAQSRRPDEVVVVTRRGDDATARALGEVTARGAPGIAFRHAEVAEPGVLPANRAGLPLATGDVLCFLDDDAAARPDWVGRIEAHFRGAPRLGAVGGRDLQHSAGGVEDEPAREVGRIRWYGRILGGHHRRLPGVHPAETLKGCNMSFRRALIDGFDPAIIGNAHHYETDLCFGVRRAGYEVLFDGDLVVDHYLDAPRYLPGNADPADPSRFYAMHHNRVYVMMKNLRSLRRVVFLAYTFLSDAAATPLRWASGLPEGRPAVVRAIFAGKAAGLRTWRSRRGARGAARQEAAA